MANEYHIRIQGHLDPAWSCWFDGLTVVNQADGDTLLAGPVVDQAALHGILIRVRDRGLTLLAVNVQHPGAAHSSSDRPTQRRDDEPDDRIG
jgi:hypothetical protein